MGLLSICLGFFPFFRPWRIIESFELTAGQWIGWIFIFRWVYLAFFLTFLPFFRENLQGQFTKTLVQILLQDQKNTTKWVLLYVLGILRFYLCTIFLYLIIILMFLTFCNIK